jgi:hypothetical protein
MNVDVPLEDASADLRYRAIALNRSFERRHLHRFGRGVGFCAEFNHCVTVLAKCLHERMQFCLDVGGTPRGVAVARGWEDYFEPICDTVPNPVSVLNSDRLASRRYALVRPLARAVLMPVTGCRSFAFDAITRARLRNVNVPELDYAGDSLGLRNRLSAAMWRLQPEVRNEVMRRQGGLPGSFDVALHIRRGDKSTEFDYVGVPAYLDALRPFTGGPVSAFVASDDDNAIEELRASAPAGVEIFSPAQLAKAKRGPESAKQGYDQATFNALPPERRRAEVLDLLTEIEIMRKARVFIGASTSNVFITVRNLRTGQTIDLTEGAWLASSGLRRF